MAAEVTSVALLFQALLAINSWSINQLLTRQNLETLDNWITIFIFSKQEPRRTLLLLCVMASQDLYFGQHIWRSQRFQCFWHFVTGSQFLFYSQFIEIHKSLSEYITCQMSSKPYLRHVFFYNSRFTYPRVSNNHRRRRGVFFNYWFFFLNVFYQFSITINPIIRIMQS